jgi:phosphohistidine swiveling domain-containing protein
MPRTAKQKPEVRTETVHFSIHGEDFTRLARERLLDDNPGSAWRIASGLIGDGDGKGEEMHAALAILTGDKKLVGKNTMELVDEDLKVAELHKERVAWLYAGRIRIGDCWYRPVAEVTSFGPKDLRNDRGKPVDSIPRGVRGSGQSGIINRQWHYCMDGEIAPLAHTHHDDADVIFQPCGELPHWLPVPRDVHEAIKQWRDAGRQLEERGHALWYKDNGDEHDGPGRGYQEWLREQQAADELAEAAAIEGEGDYGEELFDAYVDAQLRADGFVRASISIDEERRIEELRHKLEEEQRQQQLVELRAKILAQAGDDLIELAWEEEARSEADRERDRAWGREQTPMPAGKAMIPRAPFLHWAFHRLRQFEKAKPPWTPVSPVGMKMMGDSPYHSDWVIAAGFDPSKYKEVYDSPMYRAALDLSWQMQDRFSHESGVHILVEGSGWASGKVEHGRPNMECSDGAIVVLPNLHPRYLKATLRAAAVITEEGGETAHLAQVGRERGLMIARVPNAREIYEPGLEVVVNASKRTIEEL